MRTSSNRIRKSLQEWSVLLERFEQSDLNQREFCLQEGIGLSSFSRHRRELQDHSKAFIELSVSPDTDPASEQIPPASPKLQWTVEVLLPDGSELRFHG